MKQGAPNEILLKRIIVNGNTIGFRQQTQKLRAHTKLVVSCESTAEEDSFEWSQHRISSTDSRVRTVFQVSIFHLGRERV